MEERRSGLHRVSMQDKKAKLEREKGALRRNHRWRGRRLRRALQKYRETLGGDEAPRPASSFRSRLLAQSTAALCLLALALGLRALPFEGAQQLTSRLRAVATTQLDLESAGQALGQLEFVSRLVPESVLVFWNKTAAAPSQVELPLTDGRLALEQDGGAWVVGTGVVHAAADGTVLRVSRSELGGYQAVVEHSGGLTSVYEPLVGVRVAPGETLRQGQSFAVPVEEEGMSKVFFRLELNEEAVDLADYLEP